MLRYLLFSLFAVLLATACRTPQTREPINPLPEPATGSPSYEEVSAVIELTDDNFSAQLKEGSGVRIAYFWATWCGPCRLVGPVYDKVSARYRGQVLFGKMDSDAHYSDAFNNVKSLPTILFFKNGEEIYRTQGIVSEESLVQLIERLK